MVAAPVPDDIPLYEPRRKLYPQSITGTFRRIKWAILWVTLGIYYVTPFIRWDRGENAPNQAVLIDFPARRFYFFFIEIWPQEVYYLTGLLIIAAMTLFLMNALAGRIWCGYLCPQTVWTDVFYTVERFFEGDRRERMLADKTPPTINILTRRALKHVTWIFIGVATGGAWVLYFADAPTLIKEIVTLQAPVVAYIWIGILTFTTYALAGFMREQVCVYMCPWPRIQAALTDEWALNVTYRRDRGEQRMSVKAAQAAIARGEKAGDCIDCFQCVAVCPTGIDIRDGAQLACIQCGLCIDACDRVMEKVGRPVGLIGYDNDVSISERACGRPAQHKVIRPRTILYAGVITLVSVLMLLTYSTRASIGLNVLHDRNPLFVTNSDGSVRNAYTIRILNKSNRVSNFTLSLSGLENFELESAGFLGGRSLSIVVEPDQTRELRVLVTAKQAQTQSIDFTLRHNETGKSVSTTDHFIARKP